MNGARRFSFIVDCADSLLSFQTIPRDYEIMNKERRDVYCLRDLDSEKTKSTYQYLLYLKYILLILNDPIGAGYAGINWISENPTLEAIFRIRGWIINFCYIRYLTKASSKKVFQFHKEFRSKDSLHRHVLNSLKYFKNPFDSKAIGPPEIQYVSAPELLYIITRIMKPNVVVETGVASGASSTYILQALEDNKKGKLYSIDIDAYISGGIKRTGWIVPSQLRHRWHLIIGSSSHKLLPLLENLQEIDVFLHDSLHTYRNMLWEYQTAWPFIRKGGILLSDDIQENNAFSEFCEHANRKGIYVSLGGVRK